MKSGVRMDEVLLEVKDLSVAFQKSGVSTTVVQDLNFHVNANEIVCIVGESGSGKSVTAKTILKLLPKDTATYASGEVLFRGTDLLPQSEKTISKVRGSEIAMIFQDSSSSLNPVYKIKTQLADVIKLRYGKKISKNDIKKISLDLLDKVEIQDRERVLEQYPFQLSGGMRQRIQIAMNLVSIPSLLIADESTTALDVIVQKQIIALLKGIRDEHKMSLLFISHDLSVVYDIADRIIVMKDGRIVEQGSKEQIFLSPRQQYTKDLLNSIPRIFS